MAPRYRSLHDPAVSSYLDDITTDPNQPLPSPAQAGAQAHDAALQSAVATASKVKFTTPRAQSLARGVIGDTAREAEYQQRERARAEEQTARENERAQAAMAKAEADAAEANRAMNVRAGAAAGMKTETDIATGKRSIATHPDGAPVWKAGPQGEPMEIGQQSSAIQIPGEAAPTTRPFVNPLMGDDGGAIGATGGTTQAAFAQPVRDDRGNISMVQPDTTTDAKTGRQYTSKTDPTTGATVKTAVGIDQAKYDQIQRDKQYQAKAQEIALQDNAIKQQRFRFDPAFKPVATEFEAANKEIEALPPVYTKQGGIWTYTDPKTLKEVTTYDPREVERQKTLRDNAEKRHARAKEAYDKMAPNAGRLDSIEKSIRESKLRLDSDKLRMDAGLPEDDGGVAELLAGEALGAMPPAAAKVAETTGTLEPMGPPRPILTPDTDEEAVRSAYGALRGIEGITARKETFRSQYDGKEGSLTVLERDGKRIATISDGGFAPTITLTREGREDAQIRDLANLGTTGGAPLYLQRGANRKSITQEAAEVADIFTTVKDPALYDEQGKPLPALTARMEEIGATPQAIMRRVDSGDLSVQHGAAILKDLYGTTMEATDPNDPEVFKAWVAEKTQAADQRLRDLYGKPTLTDSKSPGKRLEQAGGAIKDFGAMDQVRQDFLVDQWQQNAGKPGVKRSDYVRMHREANAKAGAPAAQIVGSWLGSIGNIVKNDVAGSMVGLATGLSVQGGAGMIAWTGDAEAKAKADEFMRLRNRSFANFTDGFARNMVKWGTPTGRQAMKGFDQALSDFQQTIDAELDKPMAERDQTRIQAAKQGMAKAAKALHDLAPDEKWPMGEKDFDPDKDPVLMEALARYAATADPRVMGEFKARLLMNNGGRQLAAEMAKKVRSDGFWGAVEGGTYAGWQEIGTELLADAAMLFTAGGSKAVQGALKAAGAVGKAKRIERTGQAIGKFLEKWETVGIRPDSLAAPLTGLQKVGNTATQIGKTAIQAGAGEGMEELIVEMGADDPDLVHAALVGALGGVALTPAFYPVQRAIRAGQERTEARTLESRNIDFAKRYNDSMSGVEGFTPITPETAATARNFIDARGFDARTRQVAKVMADINRMDESTPETKAVKAQLAETFRSLSAELTAESTRETEKSIAAAQEIDAITDPARKTFMRGVAKVVGGNTNLLTQAERSSLQRATTEAGAPYFATVNGMDYVTDEARAEIAMNAPAVGALIQTTESQALIEAQSSQPITPPVDASGAQGDPATGGVVPPLVSDASGQGVQPTTATAAPLSPAGLQQRPSDELDGEVVRLKEIVRQNVTDPAGQENAQLAQTALDNVRAEIARRKADPSFVEPSAPAPAGAPNLAGMDAAQYETARAENPAMPEIGQAVAAAVAQGRPVSVSMAKAAGIETPEGYTRRGATLVPPDSTPNSTPTPAPIVLGQSVNVSMDDGSTGTGTVVGMSIDGSAQVDTGGGQVIERSAAQITPASSAAPAATPVPIGDTGQAPATPEQSVAAQVQAAVEEKMPAVKGRLAISNDDVGSGGADIDIESGNIRLSLPDIKRAIKRAKGDTAAVVEYLTNIVERHEVVHLVQTEQVKAEWEAAQAKGYTGTFLDFYEKFYTELAKELLTPEAINAARKIYGKNTATGEWYFDSIKTEWQQAAEFTRMLVEAKIDGNTGQFSELFRVVKTQGAKSKLAKIIRAAIKALTGMTLTPAVEQHIAALKELYAELSAKETTENTGPQNGQNQGQEQGQEAAQYQQPQGKEADKTPDKIPDQDDAILTAPMRATGDAISAALTRFPKLAGKLKAELRAIEDEIIDALEALPPAERISYAEKAIANKINEIADREAERTGKKREEVIESFRAVAGKQAAKQAASIEAAVIGTEAPAIPSGRQEQRDTPNSEMTVDVTSTFVDLDQLIGSSDPLFPGGALQPRNRSTQASRNQREEMVQNIRDKEDQHRRYMEGATTDSGRMVIAPLFGADGKQMTNEAGKPLFYVISGNGRRNALAEANARKVSGKIEKGFRDAAASEGIDTEGMGLPVPVSVFVPSSAKEAIDLAEYSNRDAQLSVSNTEQANRDAASIEKANLLPLWEPDASGDAAAASNRGFVKAFARAVGDEGIIDGRSELTEEGAKRIERAMVAMLLGPDQSALLDMLFNRSGTLGLRAMIGGVASEAGSLLKLAAVKPDFDLSPVLATALRAAVEAKQSLAGGEIRDVGEWFDQGNLFESSEMTPDRQLARALVESRSRKAIVEILGAYRRGAQAVDTSTMSMFDEGETTREDVILKALEARPIEQVVSEVEAEFGKNADLSAKLRIVIPAIRKLPLPQRKAMNAAIGAEVERLRDGVVSAPEWQRLNPDALSPMEAMFQRVLDSHTPQTLPAGMFKMLSRDGQAALASSPAPARDPDPRLAEEFGENFEADEYGLPKAPRVLPSGDERLDDTLGKETVTMERNHPLVVGGFIQEGSAPRSALRKAIIDYFISKATPLADSQQQTVFASGGGGGAGKTTILNKMEEEGQIDTSFAVLVNADEIKLLIPEFIELKELGEGRAAAVVHEESSKIATKLMDRLLSQRKRPRYDIIFDATLGNAETSMKKFQRWREVGAYIHLIGITIDPREAMIRAVIRGKNSGRWVPTAMLAKAHHGFNLSVMEYVAFADRATIYDNTPPKAEIIGEKKTINTQFNVANQSGFENIKLRENEFNRSSYRWTDQGQGTGQNRLGTSDRDQQGRGQPPLRSPRPESPSNDRSNEGGSPGESSRLGSSPSPAYVRLTRGDKGNDPITPTTSQVEWAERNPKSAEKLRAIIDAQAKAKGYAPAKYLHGTPGKNPALAKDAYDKNKNGLGLYEGTGEGDFTEFLREKTKEGMGLHFFTQSQIWAENFTGIEETNNNSEDGYRIIPAYLKIRNPWSVDSAEHRALIPELANERAKVLTGGFGWLSIEKPEVVERIKSLGFDAIMMRERDPGGWFDDFETVAVFESSQAKDSSLVNFEAGKMIAPAARFDESKPSILYSSPAPQLDLFGGFEAQLTGPRAKAKVNAAEMLRNAPAKAKPQIAKSIAKREGLEDLDLFAAAAVRSLDAKPRRGETTINASGSGQLGFDFDSGTPAGQQADTAGRTRGIRADQATPSRPGRSGEQAGATAGEGAASDVQGADSGRGGSGDGSAATDTRDGRGGRAEAGNRQGGGQDGGSGSPEAGKRKLVERERPPVGSPERNFTIGKDTVLAEGGTVTRLRNNLAAIDLLRTLEKEGRNAAVEEKAVLAKYVGWGGIPQVFDEMMFRKVETGEAATRRDTAKNYERYGTQYAKLVTDYRQQADTIDKWNEKWGDHYRKLKELLSPEEWTSAQESTINAHYTSPKVITAMWDAVKRLGYLGGNILEPAGGVGHYFGLMPPSIAKRSQLFGVELDSISGRIFGKLYPESQIEVTGFQDSTIPDNSQSLVISNVPFANINISDAYLDAQPDAPKFNLHNYFFEKALRVAQPGGLIAFITTSHTMDSQIAQRKWLAERADFLGAIRLPNNAFKENANTQVVTDIIFLRKPDGTPNPVSESWKATTEVPVEGGKVAINEYFARHPEMILGRLANDGSMYAGREEMTVHGNGDLADQLREAIARLPENVVGDMESAVIERLSRENAAAKDGAFIEENGKLVIKGTGEVVEAKQAARVRSFITLRDTLNSLYLMESDPDATDAEISRKRAELNRTYDTFRVVHKELHNPVNKKVLSTDPDFYRTLGLEAPQKSADGKTVTFTKADVFTKRILEPRVEPTSAESIEDAMIQSLRWKGRLDTKFVGKLMNLTMEQAESNLLSLPNVFRNPATGMLEQSTGYLAGNVRRKLRDAELAAQTNPDYNRNVEELRAVMPADVDWADIQYKIGSTWIPAEVYQDFIREKLMNGTGYPEVIYNKGVGEIIGDSFVVNQPASYRHAVDEQWGVMTKGGGVEKSAFWVAEKVLNQEDPRINRTVDKKQVYDAEATETARAAAERMADAFIEWVDANPDLQDRLHKIYNESFNSHVIPKYDGSFMQLPWVAKDFDLYPSKKHVVWRALQEGSMLVAHGVGGGKTIIGTAVAMEVRRLGLAKKPMIVVHNATLEQFATTITQMAPTARVLVARKEDLAGGKRKEFMGRIRSGDWDAVVMAHSTFDLIPDDPAWERQQINELLEELDDAIRAEGADPNETEIRKIKEPSVKELVKMRKRLKDKISKLQDRKTDDVLTFQELGIDTVIVDEAHRYKKMPFVTRQSNIAGIDTGSSQRGTAMHLRSKWIQAQNGGRGVYTMTGTPVTNTLGESWNMIRLVRPDLLKEFAVQTFDRFVSVFGNIKQSGELRPNGQYKPVTRLAEFTNIPEWNRFWGLAADVKMGDDMDVKGRPKIKGGKPALTAVERTPQVAAVIAEITKVIDRYDKMTGKEKRENNHVPLLTYAAARMAAIDVRLVNPEAADDPGSKVNAAIANVMRIYKDTGDNKGTQVIFSDSYRPLKTTKLDLSAAEFEQKANDAGSEAESEEGFNLYHDIREKLVKAGVPRSEIAIIGEAKNDKQREMMFEKVNTGEIRIIMGSTETLGTGVNMQKRMFAAHHLDVPWTPAGLEQRDGRVFRQGNMWAGIGTGEIEIMRYGMKDTLDAALWQKLETKERMIKQAVSGEVNARVIEDDAGLLNYMEQKAALSGADGMLKFELDDAVRQFKNQFRTHRNRDYDLKKAMIRAQAQIDAAERNLPELRQAAELVAPLRDVDAQEVGWSIEGGEELKGEKARKALDEIFKARRKKAGTIANAETAPSLRESIRATANGVPVVFRVASISEDLANVANPDLRWQIAWQAYFPGYESASSPASPHPGSNLSAVPALVRNIAAAPDSMERAAAQARKDIENFKSESGKPFPKLAEFRKTLIDQAALYDRMGISRPEGDDLYQNVIGEGWQEKLKGGDKTARAETPANYPGAGLAPRNTSLASSPAPTSGQIFSADYAGPRFTYGLRNRPLDIGTAPKGYIIGSDGPAVGRARWGTIQYPRQLTPDEIYNFELEVMEEERPAVELSPDLFTASRAPDAGKKLGGVTVGRMNALAAYRSLTGKREKGIKLTAKEEQQLLDAEVALGQKLAFDMEALKTKAAPPDMRPSIKRSTSGMDYRQMEMSRYGETDRAGQMTLLSSPAQRGVDYAVTKSILEGSYERTEADESAGRAFRRAVRQDKDLGAEFAGTVPEIVEQRDSDQLFGYRLGAAILSELSGKGVLIYDPEVESASGGVTVPRIPSQVFVTKEHPSIPAGAGHEAWHRLQIDHPYDAALIGAQILEQVPSGLMDAAEIPYARNYPANRRTHEIAANIFSSIVTDPLFWRIYGTPNSDAIASELEKANVPQYREAKLVRDWPELVRSVARVLRREDPTSLFSSPASFYSPLERAVEAKIPARATPEQIMATVKAAGVKAEEIKWSGIEQALGNLAVDGKVSKDTLLAYLRDEGSVRFEEVSYGYEWQAYNDERNRLGEMLGSREITAQEYSAKIRELDEQTDDSKPVRFAKYTLPGGENYREVVLAMPDEGLSIYNATSGKTIKAGFQTFGAAQEYARKEGIKDYNIEPRQSDYQSSHFPDVPNYVAHMRTNERDGGLFIEEIQSDRHQAGRKYGYKQDFTEADKNRLDELNRQIVKTRPNAPESIIAERDALIAKQDGTIAPAPFQTTWPLALFKRALRDAVASGKTWIGWTDGETQNGRYSLQHQVDWIKHAKRLDGHFVEIKTKEQAVITFMARQDGSTYGHSASGGTDGFSDQLRGKNIDDIIGKDIGERILKSDGSGLIEGDDLKVGGSGMKGFYDNMLPKEIGKYVKQWGGKVEKGNLLYRDSASVRKWEVTNETGNRYMIRNAQSGEVYREANGIAVYYDSRNDATLKAGALNRAAHAIKEVPIWRIAITPAMREGVNGGQALFSSPAPEDSAAVDAALASMRPIYRAVFEAVNSGMTPEQVMAKYSLNEKAVANILNAVRSRIATAMSAAADPSLSPAMREGKFDGGRPDLALSTIPEVAAVDQIRNESDVPGTESWADVVAEAESRLRADYAGEYDRMLALAKNQKQMDTLEVAITKLIIARETMEGRAATKEERVKLAMLIHGYREVGTETARSLAIRRDPHKSPAERHAQFIAEALFTPDEATRKTMRNASPGQQADILASWMARVDAIKAELRNRGLDLDASLAAFNKKNEARKQAEADSPRVKAAMDEAIRKLTKREKAVVEAIRGGALASQAMQITGFSKEEIQGIWTQFVADYRANMKAAALRFMATTLASSPAGNYLQQLEAEMGIFDWDVIDDTKKDFVDRREQIRNPKPAKPRKTSTPKPGTPKPEKTKAEEMLGVGDKPLTEKQIAAIERFVNSPPNYWQDVRQEVIKLFPESTGFPADYKEGENARRILSGMLMPEDINETTGTFDLNDPAAMKEVINAFAFARGTKMDALMEFWRMSILTGPQTHLVNMGSNALYAAYNLLPRRAVEAAANTALSAIGLGSQEAATIAEFSAMAKNLRSAIQLGARQALTSWRLETRTFEAYAEGETLQLEFAGVGGETFAPKLGGKIGKIMRSLSFRAMTAADEFMKHTYGQMEAAAQAHRIAKAEEKLTGAAYEARITELMKPGSKAWIRAMDSAKRITFQEDLDGTGIRAINRIDQLAELAKTGRAMPWIGRPLTFFLPFINTPTNIAKQAIEMSPLGGAVAVIDGLRALRRKVARGKMSKAEADAEAAQIYDRARLVKDVTNQTIAWTMYFAISGLVKPDDDDEDGRPVITGTQPYKTTKRGERDNAYAVMPPQSIRIGDVVFSYSRIEPFASMMAGCVDLLQEIERNNGTLNGAAASAYLMRLKDQAKDKTFLQGVSDILNAIEDPDRFAERASSNILTGFIPNIIRQPIREMDSKIRDSNPREDEGFFPAMARRVGYSIVPQLAPVKQDVWGNDIVANRGKDLLGLPAADSLKRALDPLNSSIGAVSAPIDAWIFRYNNVTADSSDRIGLTPIPSHVTATVDGKRVKLPLTVEEQREANRNAGQAARAMLGEDWDWRTATEAGAKDMADRITDTVREFQSNERERLRQKKLAEMRGME